MYPLGLKQFESRKMNIVYPFIVRINKASNLILKLTISKIENLFHFISFRVNRQKGKKTL